MGYMETPQRFLQMTTVQFDVHGGDYPQLEDDLKRFRLRAEGQCLNELQFLLCAHLIV